MDEFNPTSYYLYSTKIIGKKIKMRVEEEEAQPEEKIIKEEKTGNATQVIEQPCNGDHLIVTPRTPNAELRHIVNAIITGVESGNKIEWLKQVVLRTKVRMKRMPRYS